MEYRGFTGGLNDQCTLSYTHVNLMPVGSCVKPTSFTNKLLLIWFKKLKMNPLRREILLKRYKNNRICIIVSKVQNNKTLLHVCWFTIALKLLEKYFFLIYSKDLETISIDVLITECLKWTYCSRCVTWDKNFSHFFNSEVNTVKPA